MSAEILIIDDNSDIRFLISSLLKDRGFYIRQAANYNQALSEIDKKLPDVAIIDVKLDKGDNDGIELLTHIKKKDIDVPVIIISGHANIKMAVDSLKSGAFEFIQKPFDSQRLINFVNRAVENYGLKKGDVVTVISENSPRWLAVDQGLMRLGAINAVRGINSPSVELEYIILHSNSVGLIVQSKEIWLKLNNKEELKKRLKFIINLEDEQFESLISWSTFISSVEKENSQNNNLEKFNPEIDDVATILYTSGTTGKPKGVPLTHANFLHQIINLAYIADPEPGTSVLSVLPIWHSYERSAEYFFFSCGCSQYYTIPKFLKDDITQIKPVVMATVPRLWEAIHDGFFQALKKMPSKKQKLIKFLISNSSVFKRSLRKIRNLDINQITFKSKIPSLVPT